MNPASGADRGAPRTLRLGTRRSALALAQSGWVAERLEIAAKEAGHEVVVELVEVTTHGDVNRAPLSSLGGTGVFVSALREALLAGEIDLAVHSLKDLPTAPAADLVVAAVPPREDPRDVLVARDGLTLSELPAGARVGTGSPRRAAQLRALGFGLEVVDVRGNVDTRLRLVREGTVDAVVLARAGLLRLGRQEEVTEVIDPLLMLPAPGQGALAVECREADDDVRALVGALDDWASRVSVTAERAVLATLEAGCAAPVGSLAEVVEGEDGAELSLRAVVVSVDGAVDLRRGATVPLHEALHGVGGDGAGYQAPEVDVQVAAALGRALATEMLDDGARELMPTPVTVSTRPDQTDSQAREGDL
jgi:hydroxymethylbilane synthase